MKTRALLLALPAVLLGSCRDNRVSVDIQQICYPTAECSFGATCDKVVLGTPLLDVASLTANAPGVLVLQLENQMPDNTNTATGRLNSNDAHIDQAAIEYEGGGLSRDVFNVGNHRIPAGGTATLGIEVVRWQNGTPLRTAYGAGLRSIVAKIRLRGYTDDGARFETGEFPATLDLCSGCVSACPPDKEVACPTASMDPHTCLSTGTTG